MAQIMVLGLGSVVQQDKGLGIHAVRDLHREKWPPEVCFVDRMMLGNAPPDLDDVQALVVLDALQTGRSPGCLARLSLEEVLEDPCLIQDSLLWRGLAMAELRGQDVQVVVLGLEAGNVAYDLMLSKTLLQAYPDYLRIVRAEIASTLQGLGLRTSKQAAAVSL